METPATAGVVMTPTPADLAADFVRRHGLDALDLIFAELDQLRAIVRELVSLKPALITALDAPHGSNYPRWRVHLTTQMEQSQAALTAALTASSHV